MQTSNAYNGYNAYKNNSVNFASKEQLLLMLVEGAVRFAKIGRQAIVDGDIGKAHENIVKTENIYYELMATIDREASGEWGAAIFSVYEFIVYKLTDANIKKDVTIMDEVIPFIEEIKSIWDEAYKMSKAQSK